MLGTRGCRLAMLYPSIPEMQARAIIRAALAVQEREGETAGILFLEDVLEELVGEINDVTQSPRRFRPA